MQSLSKREIDSLTAHQIRSIYQDRAADIDFIAPEGANIEGVFIDVSADVAPLLFDVGVSGGVTYFVGAIPGTDQVIKALAVNIGFDLAVSPGPLTPTVGVFSFTGSPEDFGGGSFAASLRSGVATGVGYSPSSGKVLATGGASLSAGVGVDYGQVIHVKLDDRTVYLGFDHNLNYPETSFSGLEYDDALEALLLGNHVSVEIEYEHSDGFTIVQRLQRTGSPQERGGFRKFGDSI